MSLRPFLSRASQAPSAVVVAAVLSLAAPWSARADAGPVAPAGKAAAAKPAPATKPAWRSLSPEACAPLSEGERAKLPAAWAKYTEAARRCELTAPGAAPRVALISVFAETYYAGRAADAPWEDFPKPLLVDRDFRCVGGLPELFPFDQPRTLTLRHGLWRDGVPQEIRVQVSNPAVGGDYALPVLRWDAAEHRYRAAGAKTPADSPCPTS